jgi:hypothetical protein
MMLPPMGLFWFAAPAKLIDPSGLATTCYHVNTQTRNSISECRLTWGPEQVDHTVAQ